MEKFKVINEEERNQSSFSNPDDLMVLVTEYQWMLT
jgi:hypothetical protein